MQKLFLTFFYTGLFPKAPGTAGSIAGVAVAFVILHLLNLPVSTLLLSAIFITVIAIKEIDKYEKITGIHDSKEIVIDEVAGVWIAIALTSGTIIEMVLALIFFRIFDIWKPSYIGRIDREAKGGIGVMGDDILAGVIAAICTSGVYQLLQNYVF